MNIKDVCAHCGKTLGYHKAITFNCPNGLKSRIGYTSYEESVSFKMRERWEAKAKLNLMSEAELERKLVAWAKEQGVWTRKFSSPSQRGVPDRIFIGKAGVLFLELKAPGKKPTKLQCREMDEINIHGGPNTAAMWSNDLEASKDVIRNVCIGS